MNYFVRNNNKLRLFIISGGKTKQGTHRATYRAPEYNTPPFWRISQRSHFYLLIGKKKTRTWWRTLRSCFCHVSLNSVQHYQRISRKYISQSDTGRPSYFFDRSEKHKLGRGRGNLASYQVSLNFIQQFQRSRKCLSESEVGVAIIFFWLAQKHKLGRERWDLASCQVSNFVQRFQMRSRKCLSQSEARAAILFFRSSRKTQTS